MTSLITTFSWPFFCTSFFPAILCFQLILTYSAKKGSTFLQIFLCVASVTLILSKNCLLYAFQLIFFWEFKNSLGFLSRGCLMIFLIIVLFMKRAFLALTRYLCKGECFSKVKSTVFLNFSKKLCFQQEGKNSVKLSIIASILNSVWFLFRVGNF